MSNRKIINAAATGGIGYYPVGNPTDANYADVSLLLNGNGTNGSQVFTDLSGTPKTITAYGNAQISTAVKKYGTGAMYFDGTGDYLSVTSFPLNITQPYTIEYWLYLAASTSLQIPFSNGGGAGSWSQSNGHQMLFYYNSGSLVYQYNYGNAAIPVAMTASSISTLTWYHVAVTYDGTTTRLFVNGTSQSTATNIPVRPTTYNITYVGYIPSADASYFNGYIDDLRVTQGVARYTTNFTPPTYQLPTDTTGTVIDPLRSSTSLLLRGNGTNGSTSFTDESPNGLTVTNNGSVTVNTTTKKFGTGSMAFSGSNTLVTNGSGIVLGTGDFTIECWVYPTVVNSDDGVWSLCTSTAETSYQIALAIYNSAIFMKHSSNTNLSGTTTLAINTWYHIAVSRMLGTMKVFVNGVQESSVASTYNYTASYALLGTYYSSGLNLNGYIDDLRITKGYARYTANFTPPTYEDPIITGTVYDYNYPQVSLLLNGDGTNGSTVFKDLSSSPKTITAYGDAKISTAVKKYGTGAIKISTGNVDYLSTNIGSALGASDFTIELWFNSSSTAVYCAPFFVDNFGNSAAVAGIAFTRSGLFASTASGTWNISGYGSTQAAASFDGLWHHVAVCRASSSVYLFIDGVSVGTPYNIGTNSILASNAGVVMIGKQNTGAADTLFVGYIDDFRITKGLARYTQNFTPPTAPLPTSYS
jgi:hypothetical protein